jgi:hypothetical protein
MHKQVFPPPPFLWPKDKAVWVPRAFHFSSGIGCFWHRKSRNFFPFVGRLWREKSKYYNTIPRHAGPSVARLQTEKSKYHNTISRHAGPFIAEFERKSRNITILSHGMPRLMSLSWSIKVEIYH